MRKILSMTILFCVPALILSAQSRLTEHTLALDDPENAAAASIEDFAWLAGRWEGNGFGGIVEETWNPPLGGTMAGTFRLVQNDSPQFYEMLMLVPDGQSVSYRVKHFNPDFTGWEEKDKYVTFPLVAIAPDAIHFNGLTLKHEGDKCIHYLAMSQKDGTHREVKLEYTRRTDPAEAKK